MPSDILHVITTIERGGAETQLCFLVREQIKSGFLVEIVYLKGQPELALELTNLGAQVNGGICNRPFWIQILLVKKHYKIRPRFIHAHLPKSEILTAMAFPKNSFVFSRHNAERFWPGAHPVISRFMSRFVSSRASGGIAISNAVKLFLTQSREIAGGCQISTVHYGFDLEKRANTEAKFQHLGVIKSEKGTITLGAIGRLVPQKDYFTLIQGFALASKTFPSLRLYIVGDGYLKPELTNLVANLQLGKKVTFLGRTEFIFEFLSQIDVFVLSSLYEGLGMVLLEASAMAKPILASNNTAIPEVLGNDYPGLFPTGDIEALSQKILELQSPEVRSNLARLVKVRSGIFTPQEMWRQVRIVYLTIPQTLLVNSD